VLDEAETVFVARSDIPGRRLAYVVTTGMRLPAFSSASGRVLLAHQPRHGVARLLGRTKITRLTRHTVMSKRDISAMIDQARRDGCSINFQEIEEDLVSASVPVSNRAGLVVAALNVSSSASRSSEARMKKELLPKLKETASALAGMLP
jgi:IclR family pca regulon transcriptional regulator